MGYTAQPGASYNVQGSFNNFFATQLTAAGLPAWLPSAVVAYDYPQQPLTFPSWSVTHLGAEPAQTTQGQSLDPGWRGVQQMGLAEISCWESYQRASGAQGQHLRQMRDMAARVFATGATFQILDVYGTTTNPTGNGTLVRVQPVREVPAAADPNPDIGRVRLTVVYSWWERATAA